MGAPAGPKGRGRRPAGASRLSHAAPAKLMRKREAIPGNGDRLSAFCGLQIRSVIAEAFGAETGAGGATHVGKAEGDAKAQRGRVMRKAGRGTAGRGALRAKAQVVERRATYGGSCLGLPLCPLVRAASRPRPAHSAGDRLLARAVSLDPARTSTRGMGAGVQFRTSERATSCCESIRWFWRSCGSSVPC